MFSLCILLYFLLIALNLSQATNIEYDEHKGRIAIGRVHAGVLQKGMDVRVSLL